MSEAATVVEHRVRSRTFAALANPDYRKFYIGQGISLIGTWLQSAAVAWIVFDRTHSERMSGLVEAAGIVPGVLVGVLAGDLADRVVPKTMILLSQLAQMALAFGLAAVVVLGVVSVWPLALIVALTRVFVTFEMPARQVFLYEVVGRSSLMNAIALNSGLFNASRVVGPALAGVCLARLGGAACFTLNGVSYLAAIASLLLIRVHRRPIAHVDRPRGAILGGFRYLMEDGKLRSLFVVITAFGLVGGGFPALVPSYAQRVIGTGTGGFSLLLAAGGIGATLGALAVASMGGLRRRDRLLLAGTVIYTISIVAAATVPTLLGSPGGMIRLACGSICLAGQGVGGLVFYATAQTMIQTSVPDALRGRIMGIWMIVFSGSVPLGCLWAGELAQAIGVAPAMELMAGLCGLLALGITASGRLAEAKDSASAPALAATTRAS
jgi:MFS family permease